MEIKIFLLCFIIVVITIGATFTFIYLGKSAIFLNSELDIIHNKSKESKKI